MVGDDGRDRQRSRPLRLSALQLVLFSSSAACLSLASRTHAVPAVAPQYHHSSGEQHRCLVGGARHPPRLALEPDDGVGARDRAWRDIRRHTAGGVERPDVRDLIPSLRFALLYHHWIPHSACDRRTADPDRAPRLDIAWLFRTVARRPRLDRGHLLAFRRCGLAHRLLQLLHHAPSHMTMMTEIHPETHHPATMLRQS